jgi:hypothetical protein
MGDGITDLRPFGLMEETDISQIITQKRINCDFEINYLKKYIVLHLDDLVNSGRCARLNWGEINCTVVILERGYGSESGSIRKS